tara:strand:- start:124 stop:348 length:225 start_codon:yes stop_codon:yes gene_type:complete
MVSINESKFNFRMIGISPETDQQEFECSLEDFLTENQDGFTITLDEMFQAIINAKEDVPIYEVSDKILVVKRRK